MSNPTQESIKAKELALVALKKEAETLGDKILKNRQKIQAKFNKFVLEFDKFAPFIPERMKASIQFVLGEEVIRPTWIDYNRPNYNESFSIYYRSPQHYENHKTNGNHSWELNLSSGKMYIDTLPEMQEKRSFEYTDMLKLAQGMMYLINCSKEKVIAFHEEMTKNQSSGYEMGSAIRNLESEIESETEQIENDKIIRFFKPAGQTAAWLMNTEIVLPHGINWFEKWNKSGRRRRSSGIHFDAIKIVKETKAGVRAEFIRIFERDGEEMRYVTDTKLVKGLGEFILMYKEALREKKNSDERQARIAERERKAQEELANQNQ